MGYCMWQEQASFTIKNENKEAALLALKELANTNELSWTDNSSVIKSKSLSEALNECRWGMDENEEGDIVYIFFDGEKYGSEDIIFNTIAPYVEQDSFIEMRGEEGELWRWVFDGETVEQIYPKVIWS